MEGQWNPQGYGTLMEQTGNDYEEQQFWDNFADSFPTPERGRGQGRGRGRGRGRKRGRSRQDVLAYHNKKAEEVFDRFFTMLNLEDTTEEQDEILYNSIRNGTTAAGCMGGEYTKAGYHWHEVQALEDIEPDNRNEWIILDAMHNGIFGHSGYTTNPAAKRNGDYVYKRLEKLLDEHDKYGDYETSPLENLSKGIIDVWIENIQNEEYPDFVCYRGKKNTIGQVFGMTKGEYRIYNHGDKDKKTWRDIWNERDRDDQAQAAVDTWESMIPTWSDEELEMYLGGKKKRKKKNRKKTEKKYISTPFAITNQYNNSIGRTIMPFIR